MGCPHTRSSNQRRNRRQLPFSGAARLVVAFQTDCCLGDTTFVSAGRAFSLRPAGRTLPAAKVALPTAMQSGASVPVTAQDSENVFHLAGILLLPAEQRACGRDPMVIAVGDHDVVGTSQTSSGGNYCLLPPKRQTEH